MSDVPLPLTEAHTSTDKLRERALTSAGIVAIVRDFYRACRCDPLLGPVFMRHVHDWPAHLARIEAFWSSALLKSGTYSGRPIEIHEGLDLTPAHFAQWMKLWNQAVRAHATPHDARISIEAAASMARAMIERGYLRHPPADPTSPNLPPACAGGSVET